MRTNEVNRSPLALQLALALAVLNFSFINRFSNLPKVTSAECITCSDPKKYEGDCDFDGDGIINSIDIDDDNDGVLDLYEIGGEVAESFEVRPTAVSGSPDHHRNSAKQWGIRENAFEGEGFIGLHPTGSGGASATFEKFTLELAVPMRVGQKYIGSFVQAVGYLYGLTNNSWWNTTNRLGNNPGFFQIYVGNSSGDEAELVHTSEVIPRSGLGWQRTNFEYTPTQNFTFLTIVPLGTGAAVPYMLMDDFRYGVKLDTDLDGIPNVFDLDSDDDGCSDAFESGVVDIDSQEYQFDSGTQGANGFQNDIESSDLRTAVYSNDGKKEYSYDQAIDGVSICCAINVIPILMKNVE